MNESRYQQLLQRRFGRTDSPMKTVSYKALDAQVGADEAAREYQLKSLGLSQESRDRNFKFAKGNLGLQQKAYKNELSDMKAANWLGAGGAVLGLGQGLADRKYYDRLAETLRGQQKMIAPPNYGYGYGVGNSRYGIGGE